MNESGDVGMEAEDTGRQGAPPNDALAAARAALAALDKANAAGGSEKSSRDELAAARQALTVLGEAQDAAAPTTRRRPAEPDTEWALPVVDAPPPRFDAPAEPVVRERSGAGDGWALPVLDAPVSGGAEGATARRASGPPAPGTSHAAASPSPRSTATPPSAPTTAPDTPGAPSRPRRGGDPGAEWAAPVLDAPSAPAPERADQDRGATTPPSPPHLAGDPHAEWAAPVLDAPPAPDEAHGHAADAPRRPDAPSRAADSARPTPEAEPDEAELKAVHTVLAAGGAPVRLAGQAFAVLGPDAAELLREDPWNLLALPGISPQQADLFARADSADPDDPRRTLALITWHLRRAAGRGHTAADAASLVGALEHLGVRDAFGALRAAYDQGRIMAFAEPPAAADDADAATVGEIDDEAEEFDDGFGHPFDSPADHVTVALERHALAEESIAEAVLRLLSTVAPSSGGPTALPDSGVVLYVPGTGEDPPSVPLTLARELGPRALVVCPTDDGAARVRDFLADDRPVVTTLRALFADRAGPARGMDGLVDTDLLVVCEAHLLDVQSAAAVLEVVPDGARVVLCGDPDELQPAAPGRVFADLRDSDVVPVVVSSEQGPGVLGQLAAAVRAGSLPPVESPDRQVVLVGVRGAAEAVHRCVQLVADSIPRALGIPADDVMVVTPAEGGSAGVTALNAALKERLNPGPGRYAGFDVGDRVVRVPGPRTSAPAEGRVVEALPDGLAVAFRDAPDEPETVPRARLGELRHGWAVTVREALGTRRPGVVAMLPGDAGDLVTRALVYTAFTRARRHLSVVYPADGTLPQAVARRPAGARTTRLAAAVREAADQMLGSPEEPDTD